MKRTFALIIAVLMLAFGVLSFSVFAADSTDPAYVYFMPPTEGDVAWTGFSTVYCHMWEKGGSEINAWQSKKEKCEDLGNGFWRYDVSGIDFNTEGRYSLIFSNEIGAQTYDLNVTSSCLGDIVYCDGTVEQNPVDNKKICAVARWMHNPDVHPAIEKGTDGHIINVDGIDEDEAETLWGEGKGDSYEMKAVATATQAEEKSDETKVDADAQVTKTDESAAANTEAVESTEAPTEAAKDTANPDGINLRAATIGIIVVCVVLACAIIVVVIILSKKNKKNQ